MPNFLRHQLLAKVRTTRAGVTSLYIVIFASLLFTVIAVGFVAIIMSETAQTVNDELSQSAYDSALAGIEDAKLAIMKCQDNMSSLGCSALNTDVGAESSGGGCKTVASILGYNYTAETGTLINDSNSASSLETLQAYTCVTIRSELSDYRSYLSSTDTDTVRLVPLRAATGASSIKAIRISWYAATDSNDYIYRNINGSNVSFAPVNQGISAPPTIAVQLIQTAARFTLESSEIDYTVGSSSDRGTIFLVPTNKAGIAIANNHIGNTGKGNSQYGALVNISEPTNSGFLKANDKAQTNVPYIIKCEEELGSEFACSATIELPEPVNGNRSDQTAMLVVSMPYDQPSTDFAVELCGDNNCDTIINFKDAQYAVDSTGRANDVYNRVEARIELSDIYFPYPEYAVHLTGTDDTFVKIFWAAPVWGVLKGCPYSNNGEVVSSTLCSGFLNNP